MAKYMIEKPQLSFWLDGEGVTVPPEMLGTVTFASEEPETEISTQAATIRQGSGRNNASVTATIFLPSMGYLGNFLRSKFNAATNPADPGNVIIKAGSCSGSDRGVLHIHSTCNEDDKDDIHIYSAVVMNNSEIEFSEDGSALSVELTFHAQPDDDGNLYRLGTGDLTQDVLYDPETDTYEPVES